MRILLLSHRVPYPPDKGDKIRSFRLLQALCGRHDVWLVTHADDRRDLRHLPELRRRCRGVSVFGASAARRAIRAAGALLSGRALSLARFDDARAAQEVRRVLSEEEIDAVVVFSAQPFSYLPENPGIPVIVDLVDVDSEKWAAYARVARGWKRRIYEREARIVRAFERTIAGRCARVAVATEREAGLFRAVVSDRPVSAIANGVEVEPVAAGGMMREAALLVFVGAMDYEPNARAAETAAREILPLVRVEVPGVRLRIVGRNPTRSVRALAKIPGVEVTGTVAEVGPEIARAAVSLIPLDVVRGVPNKVLEAFAHGTPVVATPAVLEAVGAITEEHALAGEDPMALSGAVVRLLRDPAFAARIGAGGRDLAATRFRWDRFDAEMAGLVEEVTHEGTRAWGA